MVTATGGYFGAGLQKFIYHCFTNAICSAGHYYYLVFEIGKHLAENFGKPTLIFFN